MCHVLIIEDEVFVAMTIEDIVLEAGASSVDIAITESAAIEAAEQRCPDFITSDVRLAEGYGTNAVAAIHERCGSIPTLFITATPDACRPFEPHHTILSKPFMNRDVARNFAALVSPDLRTGRRTVG